MVTGTLCGSVVARTKVTCGGGSSSVFRRALNASVVSMWTSSMTYTFLRSAAGNAVDYIEMDGASNRGIDAIRDLTEAVRYQPAAMVVHGWQTPHGSAVGPFSQLS